MNQSSIRIRVWVIAALFVTLAPRFAWGDGGVIRLREVQGPFSVTVFTSIEALAGGSSDVSVLVQWRNTGEVVLDADVNLTLNPPDGVAISPSDPLCGLSSLAAASQLSDMRAPQLSVRATREQASNKLLYAALVKLNAAGDWRLHVLVSRGSDCAGFDCLLPAATASSTLRGIWPYLALPPIAIAAFAMNQRLRRHWLERLPLETDKRQSCRSNLKPDITFQLENERNKTCRQPLKSGQPMIGPLTASPVQTECKRSSAGTAATIQAL